MLDVLWVCGRVCLESVCGLGFVDIVGVYGDCVDVGDIVFGDSFWGDRCLNVFVEEVLVDMEGVEM